MAVEAARASGLTKGLLLGTRSSSRLCAKKQMRLRQPAPSLHSCVRYLQTERGVQDVEPCVAHDQPMDGQLPVAAAQPGALHQA